MLHEFVTAHRAEIISRCRDRIASLPAPCATDVELDHGVPRFLDQLTDTLRDQRVSIPAIGVAATKHGEELARRGATVAQVVCNYSVIWATITELACEQSAPITTDEVHLLGRCLEEAIASAVTEHARLRDHERSERLERIAHDLRNALNSAVMSFDMLGTCGAELDDSIRMVLGRSLAGLGAMIDSELAEGRSDVDVLRGPA